MIFFLSVLLFFSSEYIKNVMWNSTQKTIRNSFGTTLKIHIVCHKCFFVCLYVCFHPIHYIIFLFYGTFYKGAHIAYQFPNIVLGIHRKNENEVEGLKKENLWQHLFLMSCLYPTYSSSLFFLTQFLETYTFTIKFEQTFFSQWSS